jgi:hypothetical protein
MNFLSHDTAYALYPFSTFCARTSLAWGVLTPNEHVAAKKYVPRGWALNHFFECGRLDPAPFGIGSQEACGG